MRNSIGFTRARPSSSKRATQLFVLTAFAAALPRSWANPTGGAVVQGAASIQGLPSQLVIQQTTDRAVINWQGFGIGQGESVEFRQPSSSAVILNRVTGRQASEIQGQLQANGHVWLVNPNGIFFGPNANVNVAGLLATTLDIADDDFMAGRYRFQGPTGSTATVENQGLINIRDAGMLAFVAPGVANRGVINARLGSVTLASGTKFTVDFYGDQRINIALADGSASTAVGHDGQAVAAVQQDGAIFADGGTVQITAAAARGMVDHVINVGGVVQARSVDQTGGKIILSGAEGSTLNVSGTLDLSARDSGSHGGEAVLRATDIVLQNGSRIDASGESGGGNIEIGGALHGLLKPDFTSANAQTVTMQSAASVVADATGQGNGGTISIWADGSAGVHGSLSAAGGAQSGNGGFIETSGASALDGAGVRVSTLAPAGQVGTWLLDPTNINIDQTYANTIVSNLAGGNVTVSTGVAGDGGPDAGVISILQGVLLQPNLSADRVLTLSAFTNIDFNNSVRIEGSGAGKLNLVLNANTGSGTDGAVRIGDFSNSGAIYLNTNGGNLIVGGGSCTITGCSGYASSTGGRSGIELYNVNIQLGGGNLDARAQLSQISAGALFVSGTAINSGGGNITLEGVSANGPGLLFNSAAAVSSLVADSGSITLRGTGATADLSIADTSFLANNIALETGSASGINTNSGVSFVGNAGSTFALRPLLDSSNFVLGGVVSGDVYVDPAAVLPLASGFQNLELGRRTSTGSTTIGGAISTSIPNLTVFGGGVGVTGSITLSSSTRGLVRLQAINNVSLVDGASITAAGTGAVDVVISSNSNPNSNPGGPYANSGFIDIGTGGAGVSITTNGGNLTLGGGDDCTATQCFYNTYRVGDGAAAINFIGATINLGNGGSFRADGLSHNGGGPGLYFVGTTVTTNGGHMALTGAIDGGNNSGGIYFNSGLSGNALSTGTLGGYVNIAGLGTAGAADALFANLALTSPNVSFMLSNVGNPVPYGVPGSSAFNVNGGGSGAVRFYPLNGGTAFNVGSLLSTMQPYLSGVANIELGARNSSAPTVIDQSLTFSNQSLTIIGDSVEVASNVSIQYNGTGNATLTLQALSALPIAQNFGGVFIRGGASLTATRGLLNVVANGNGGFSPSSQAAVVFSPGSTVTTRGGNVVIGGGTCTVVSCSGVATSSAFVSAVDIESSAFNLGAGSFYAAANSMFGGLGLYYTGSSINTAGGNITLQGTSLGQAGLFIESGSLNAGSGSIVLRGQGGPGNSDVQLGATVAASTVTLELGSTGGVNASGASLTGTGTLVIRPQLDTSSFNVGGANAGDVYVDATSILGISSGFSALELGRRTATAATNIGQQISTTASSLSIFGGDVNVLAAGGVTLSGAGRSLLRLQARQSISLVDGSALTSGNAGGMNVLITSNSNPGPSNVFNNNSGFITIGTGTGSTGVNISTNGGNVNLGGGSDCSVSQCFYNTTRYNGGSAISLIRANINLGTGGRFSALGLASNNGGSTAVTGSGIDLQGSTITTAGGGSIRLDGSVSGGTGTAAGINFTNSALGRNSLNTGMTSGNVGLTGQGRVDAADVLLDGLTLTSASVNFRLNTAGNANPIVATSNLSLVSGGSGAVRFDQPFGNGAFNVGTAPLAVQPYLTGFSRTEIAGFGSSSATILNQSLTFNTSELVVTGDSVAVAPGVTVQYGGTGTATLTLQALSAQAAITGGLVIGSNASLLAGSGRLNVILNGRTTTSSTADGPVRIGDIPSAGTTFISTNGGNLTIGSGSCTVTSCSGFANASRDRAGIDFSNANIQLGSGSLNARGSLSLISGGAIFLTGSTLSSNGGTLTLEGMATGSNSFGIASNGTGGNSTLSAGTGSIVLRGTGTGRDLSLDSTTLMGRNVTLELASTAGVSVGSSSFQGDGLGSFIVRPQTAAASFTLGGAVSGNVYLDPTAVLAAASTFQTIELGRRVSNVGTVLTLNSAVTGSAAAFNFFGYAINIGSNGAVSNTATGGVLSLVSSSTFTNTATSPALTASGGRWLVYSSNIDLDNRGTLVGDFNRYGCSFTGCVAGVAVPTAGNGFFYSVRPTLTANAGNASSVYGSTPNLSTVVAGYSGFKGGDSNALLNTAPTFSTTATATTNVGSAAISINLAGVSSSAGYLLATGSTGVLSITPAALTIRANDTGKPYDAVAFNGGNGVSYLGFVNGQTAAVLSGTLGYAGSSQGAIDAGSYVITPTGLSSSNYSITNANGLLSITPVALTATANSGSRVYDATAIAGGYGLSYSGFVGGQNESVLTGSPSYSGASQTAVNVGSYAITPGGLASSNYVISFVDGLLNITPRNLDVTANGATKTYDGVAFTGGNGVSYNGFATGDNSSVLSGTLSYTGTSQNAVNAGSYFITPTGLSASNYSINNLSGALTITPAALTITANDATRSYTGLAASAGNGVIYSGFVGSDTQSVLTGSLSYGGTSQTAVNVGSYGITPGGLSSGNYTISTVDGSLSITPASLNVTAVDVSKIYDGLAFNGGNGVRYAGFVNGETAAVLGGALSYGGSSQGAVNAGGYLITPTGLTSPNYVFNYANGTLAVTPASLVITANDATRGYSGVAQTGGNGVRYAGFVNGENESVLAGSLSYGGSSQSAVNAGSYGITPGGLSSGNYDISNSSGTLTITPVNLDVIANDARKTYDGLAYSGGNGVRYAGFVNGESAVVLSGTLSYVGSSQGAVNAGAYSMTPNGLLSGNYVINNVSGLLTVDPAALTITANAATRLYSGLAQAGGNGVSYAGFVNGETASVLGGTLSYSGSSQTAINVGSYALVPGGQISSNYTISTVASSLSITPTALLITANDAGKIYDGLAYGGGNGVAYTGFVNGEDASVLTGTVGYSGSSQGAVNVGSYVITPGGQSSSNYAISTAAGSLAVTPAPLSISANDAGKIYDGLAYSGGNGVRYAGFVNGENASVLGGALSYGGNSQGAVNAGGYLITPGGQTSSNYQIASISGSLLVDRANLNVTANDADKTYDGLAFNGGNGVRYAGFVNGENASALGGTLGYSGTAQGAVDAGSYGITPTGQTSDNYRLSYTDGSLRVAPAPLTVTAQNVTRTYVGVPTSDGNAVRYEGFVNGETPAVLNGTVVYGGSGQSAVNVGTYVVTPGGQASRNYAISYRDGQLQITPRTLDVIANDDGKFADGVAYSGGNGVRYQGFVNGEGATVLQGTLSYSGSSQGAVNAGTYVITPNGQTSSNYAISYRDGSLTVAVPPTVDLVVVVSNVVRSVVASVPQSATGSAVPQIEVIVASATPTAAVTETTSDGSAETTEANGETTAASTEAAAEAAGQASEASKASAEQTAAAAESAVAAAASASAVAASASSPAAAPAKTAAPRAAPLRLTLPSIPVPVPVARPMVAQPLPSNVCSSGGDCRAAVAAAAANTPPQLTVTHMAIGDPMAASYDEMPWHDNSGAGRLGQPKQVRSYLETLETTNLVNVLLILVP